MPAWMSLLDALEVPDAKSFFSKRKTSPTSRSAKARSTPAPTMPPPTITVFKILSGLFLRAFQSACRVRKENSNAASAELGATMLFERRLDSIDDTVDVAFGQRVLRVLQSDAER